MPYLVGDLIKEIEADGSITSFPKSFRGPPKTEKEKEAERYDEMRAERAKEDAMRRAAERLREDWVRNKWAEFYEMDHTGQEKPNFSMMPYGQFQEYMRDAQQQARLRRDATPTHRIFRDLLKGSALRRAVAVATEPQVATDPEPRLREKPRVKAHITKEEYLKKKKKH